MIFTVASTKAMSDEDMGVSKKWKYAPKLANQWLIFGFGAKPLGLDQVEP